MSAAQTLKIDSTSLATTLELAAGIGHKLRGGEVIELVSDLGAGKTAFVKGLAAGMGSHDTVHSPSFTISNQYRAGRLTLHHFDFYRLTTAGIMRNELAEFLLDPQAVVAIEWAEIVKDVLPTERLRVQLQIRENNTRSIIVTVPRALEYLVL